MDIVTTEMLNSVEPVTDEIIKVDSVTAPSKSVKKQKTIIKDCKVLYWNKESKNFAFQYNSKQVQIVLSEPLKKCAPVVKIRFSNGKYELLER